MKTRTVLFRNAEKEDAKLFFQWKNDPSSRKMSTNSQKIPWKSHRVWFEEKLDSDNYCIKVATDQKKTPIGYLRLEKISKEWIIHFYITNEHRGKGYGKVILQKGIKDFQKLKKTSLTFKALVLQDNKASTACFLSCDFKQNGYTQIKEKKFLIFSKRVSISPRNQGLHKKSKNKATLSKK
jgi:RimJ/RimL family protein N-acetyltransferase